MQFIKTFKGVNGTVSLDINSISEEDSNLINFYLQDIVDGFKIRRCIPGDAGILDKDTRGYSEQVNNPLCSRIIFNDKVNVASARLKVIKFLKNKSDESLNSIIDMVSKKTPTKWMSNFDFESMVKELYTIGINNTFYEVEHSDS